MGDSKQTTAQDKWMAHPSIGVQVSKYTSAVAAAPPVQSAGQAASGQSADAAGQPGQPAPSGASLVNNPDFERLIEAMEADAEEADRVWKSHLSDGVFTYLAPEVRTQYEADGSDCENARGVFNSEWNQIVLGRGDPKKLLAAYDIYSLRIGALQRANERLEALIAIDFAKLLAPFLAFVMRVKKFQLAQKFQLQLNRLMTQLEEAESAVTKAEVKTALNIAVSVFTTIFVPEATLVKVLAAGGGMVAHIVIDRSLGEGTVTGTVVFVAGDAGEFVELSEHGKEAIEKLKGGSKSIGVAAAAITAVLDVHDIYEGKEKVEKVAARIEEVKKGYDELMAGVLPLIPEFIVLDKLIRSIPAVLNKALAAGDSAAKNYDAVKREIQSAIQEGG